jgi:hypothetical protein
MLSNSSGELPSTSEYGTAGYTFGCLEGGRRVESYSKMSISATSAKVHPHNEGSWCSIFLVETMIVLQTVDVPAAMVTLSIDSV